MVEWLAGIGSISGVVALLGLAFFAGKYVGKINSLCRVQEQCPISTLIVKTDALWSMKDELAAVLVKADTLWKLYIEDNLMAHSSNPGVVLPEELKAEIRVLLENDDYLTKVAEPTLLVVGKIGVRRLAELAKANGTNLGGVVVQVNEFVFECLRR